jgi:hypothetical protein
MIKEAKLFRHSAAFGKRIEYYVIGLMLKEGLDVYLPIVDDDAIDAVIKKRDGSFVEVQIKARSNTVRFGDGALFAAIKHEQRTNYWFVFYSERLSLQKSKDIFWILSSQEFIEESGENTNGKNKGKRWIKFNGKNTRAKKENLRPKFNKYLANNFERIVNEDPDKTNIAE